MKTNNTQRHNLVEIWSVVSISILLILSNFVPVSGSDETVHSAASMRTQVESVCGYVCVTGSGSDADKRSAEELRKRLLHSGSMIPGVSVLLQAIVERKELLKKSVMIVVNDSSQVSAPAAEWTIALTEYPELLKLQYTWASASYVLDELMLAEYLRNEKFGEMLPLVSASVVEQVSDGKVTRAGGVATAHDGFSYDYQNLSGIIAQAFLQDIPTLSLHVSYEMAVVQIGKGLSAKKLQLLASGISNFSDSPPARVWNIEKAVNERVNNVVVLPGMTFSFVDTLDAPVTLAKGWKEGLGLFGGGAALTPGAGVCQVTTTVYRAALLAGLSIVEKRNHSLWVDHYEPYGVGLDATIFPGVHDFRFRNDTADSILIQSFTRNEDVIVNIYGVSDDRSVRMDGPYFSATAQRARGLRPLGHDEIGWVRTVKFADGSTEEMPLISTYHKGIPRSIPLKYAKLPGETIMHASAPLLTP